MTNPFLLPQQKLGQSKTSVTLEQSVAYTREHSMFIASLFAVVTSCMDYVMTGKIQFQRITMRHTMYRFGNDTRIVERVRESTAYSCVMCNRCRKQAKSTSTAKLGSLGFLLDHVVK